MFSSELMERSIRFDRSSDRGGRPLRRKTLIPGGDDLPPEVSYANQVIASIGNTGDNGTELIVEKVVTSDGQKGIVVGKTGMVW